ncbi:tyrosine-protein phosphatase [Arthrobacter sp. Z1-15]
MSTRLTSSWRKNATAASLAAGILLVSGCSSNASTATSPNSTPAATKSIATSPTPRLSSADNFRDLAGPNDGYVTASGERVNHGVILRSNALTLTPSDVHTVESLDITAIYDLRTTSEIEAKPNVAVAGATSSNINISGDGVTVAAADLDIDTPQTSMRMLEDMNRMFVNDPAQREGFAQLLNDLAEIEGPQLIHCTAGKDRTGWASAMLLSIAGVSREDITADYLLTNEYSKDSISHTLAKIAAEGGQPTADAYAPLLGVQQSFLDAGFDEITTKYSTVDKYLTHGLGLSPETIATIKAKLVS